MTSGAWFDVYEQNNAILANNTNNDPKAQVLLLESFLAGLYIYLLYLCKEVALVFLIAYIIMLSHSIIFYCKYVTKYISFDSETKKALILTFANFALFLLGFIIPFIVLKLTLFSGWGNSYNQQDTGILKEGINFFLIAYSLFYFCILSVISYGIFPIILPYIKIKKISEPAKELAKLLALLLLLTAVVVAFTISVREDWGTTTPRIHLRYSCYLYLPYVILMLHACENTIETNSSIGPWMDNFNTHTNKFLVGIPLVLCLWCIYCMAWNNGSLVPQGVAIDQTMLYYLSSNQNHQMIVFALFTIVMLIAAYALIKKVDCGKKIILILLVTLSFWNNCVGVNTFRFHGNKLTSSQYETVKWMTTFIKQHSEDNILIVADGRDNTEIATYINNSRIFTVTQESFNTLTQLTSQELTWNDVSKELRTPAPTMNLDFLPKINYILIYNRGDIIIQIPEKYANQIIIPVESAVLYEVCDPIHIPKIESNWKTGQLVDVIDGF